MGRPLVFDIAERPLTSIIVSVCCVSWTLINSKGLGYTDVGLSYEAVVNGGEYWRLISATFSHVSIIHLLFNMTSLWSLGYVETMDAFGSWVYLKYTVILTLVPLGLVLLMYHGLIFWGRRDDYRRTVSVGYSCVVFGWMTILAQTQPTHNFTMLGVVDLPMNLAPFGSLVLTSFIVPQASFIGHLAGIFVGYSIAWDCFSWMDINFTINLLIWIVIGTIYNLQQTNRIQIPFIQRISMPELPTRVDGGGDYRHIDPNNSFV